MSAPYRKKLIEVSLPLEAINAASAREKSIRHGHPSTLHLWWARRPLAAARAILFAQLVDDPSSWVELYPTEEAQNAERKRLFRVIEDLVTWENSNNSGVINAARLEIARSHARSSRTARAEAILGDSVTASLVNEYLASELPPIHDPFAGGGTIPLEAQRLGLRAIATDLNPVAVSINKALIDVPALFSGRAPVNPLSRTGTTPGSWLGAQGLADDVRYYGAWMREQAKAKIGAAYPEADLPPERGGGKAVPMAWLWARTVESPNPAFRGRHVPLVSSYWLSTKPGHEAWVVPVVDGDGYHFDVHVGTPPSGVDSEAIGQGTKLKGASFRCLLSGVPITADYIRSEGRAGRLSSRLMAIVVAGRRGRIFLPPTSEHERAAAAVQPSWTPDERLPERALGFRVQNYGLLAWKDLFSQRQLAAMSTLGDLASAARARVLQDAGPYFDEPSTAQAYADAVGLYLALAVGKQADNGSALCSWHSGASHLKIRATFGRQALPMVWDYAEGNPFSESSGNFGRQIQLISEVLDALPHQPVARGLAYQREVQSLDAADTGLEVFNTDPPYYDNVPYADLSDFFYVWLRPILAKTAPDLFRTVVTPKRDELIADPFRFDGGMASARDFFESGMAAAFARIRQMHVTQSPLVVYYAFKQTEVDADENDDAAGGTSSTGWESMLSALVSAGFAVTGTWPVRTELANRMRGMQSNALASSIVLVCEQRSVDAVATTRGEFRRMLRKELPDSLKKLQQGNIAPVDVAQASIGPGMAIFSRHRQVLEADGSSMTVRAALQLINEVLDEYLASGEGDFDPDTRFAITWYELRGWESGPFGEANTLATARNVSVDGVVEAGICHSAAGKVRILRRPEMRPLEYDPATDERPTIWEFTQHMIRLLETEGEESAARLLKKLGSAADATRELAYRLYNTCERKKWAEDARSYNGLILAWPELEKLAPRVGDDEPPEKPTKKGGKKTKAPKKGQQKLFPGDEE
jgi:putative DNA methylase